MIYYSPPSIIYFPQVYIVRDDYSIMIQTNIRKKYRGTWYLWEHKRMDGLKNIENALQQFYMDCYMTVVFGKLTKKNIKTIFISGPMVGKKVFQIDPLQISEEERFGIKIKTQ